MVFLIILTFLCASAQTIASSDFGVTAKKIEELRLVQRTALLSSYRAYEKSIHKIKQEHNNAQVLRVSKTHYFCLLVAHSMPFVIWQLIFLICLGFLVSGLIKSWFIRVLLLAGFLAAGLFVLLLQKERQETWITLREQKKMYLGPEFSYPEQGMLFPLDEVRELSKKELWSCVEMGGMKGWINHA